MPQKSIQIETISQRTLLTVGVVFCVVAVIFIVKWSIGHTISTRAAQKEIAELSTALAPDDPQTHYVSAVLHEKSFQPEDLEKAVTEYEKAAALSPNDYLLWLALGKARERNGDTAGAEKSLRHAVELAPNYAAPRWTLGNNLLRQGKTDEGFGEIRLAAVGGEKYVVPAISTAWQIFDGDISKIRQVIGDSPKLNAFLAVFLLNQERFDDAFEVWNILSEEMKSSVFLPQSEELYNRLIAKGKYRYARQVKSSIDGRNTTDIFGKLTYGGFENNNKKSKPDFFDWQIADGPQPLVGYDDKIKHGGDLSLVLIFNSPSGQDFRVVSQTVAVETGKSYRFEGFYKSDLKTSATLRWEILNVSDRSVIASTDAVAANSDWTNFGVDFIVPENAEAIIVNLARLKCGSTICPITGKVWFDDFVLQEK